MSEALFFLFDTPLNKKPMSTNPLRERIKDDPGRFVAAGVGGVTALNLVGNLSTPWRVAAFAGGAYGGWELWHFVGGQSLLKFFRNPLKNLGDDANDALHGRANLTQWILLGGAGMVGVPLLYRGSKYVWKGGKFVVRKLLSPAAEADGGTLFTVRYAPEFGVFTCS